MVNPGAILKFFSTTDSREHCTLLRNSIEDLISDYMHKGYMMHAADAKKRMVIMNTRNNNFIKKFIDYLTEIHSLKKK